MILGLTITSELIYKLINSNISDDNGKKLVNVIIDDVLIEKIDFDKVSIIEYIMEHGLSDININYICKNFNNFKLKDKFIEYLDTNNEFTVIKGGNLDSDFIKLTLSKTNVLVSSKIDIAITKIKGYASKDELVEIFLSIEDIAELAEVWNNKRPALNNFFKKQVGEALIKFGYVSKRNDRDYVRIMERKKGNYEKRENSLL